MNECVPNITGFVINMTECVLNMTGYVINMTEFVPIMTAFGSKYDWIRLKPD